MFRYRLLMGVAAASVLMALPVSFAPLQLPIGVAAAQAATANISFNVFFDRLSPHGVWVKNAKYQYVFHPRVEKGWTPYTQGHWVYLADWGWYFASDEPFAWAVYHYGRWFNDSKLGWCWVPGNAWAPAWVSWRKGKDYVGWAPLPPEQDGFSLKINISKSEPRHDDWIFVPVKNFLKPKLSVEVTIGNSKPDRFKDTEFVGPVVLQNNIIVNNVININFIEQQTNQKVVIVKPQGVDSPDQASGSVKGETIAVFAPQVADPKKDEAPKQAVDENQAQQQLGQAADQSSSQMSSGEQPSSAASSEPAQSSAASSSEQPSTRASSEPASAMSSSEAPASSSMMASSSEPAATQSSSAAASSEAPMAASSAAPVSAASSEAPVTASSAEPVSSSAAPPAASSEEQPSAAPASSEPAAAAASSQPAAEPSSAEPSQAAPVCAEGQQLVKNVCVPIASSAAQ